MKIQVNAGDVKTSEAVVQRVEEELENALRVFRNRVTRVEVHLRDLNGPKSGVDKRCVMEARLAGQQPIAVEHDSENLYEAINMASEKLERAVRRRVEREREKKTSV